MPPTAPADAASLTSASITRERREPNHAALVAPTTAAATGAGLPVHSRVLGISIEVAAQAEWLLSQILCHLVLLRDEIHAFGDVEKRARPEEFSVWFRPTSSRTS
jgi:hypothetical protein